MGVPTKEKTVTGWAQRRFNPKGEIWNGRDPERNFPFWEKNFPYFAGAHGI